MTKRQEPKRPTPNLRASKPSAKADLDIDFGDEMGAALDDTSRAPALDGMFADESQADGRERRRRPLEDGKSYRLVTFSFYEDDVQRLDALLAEARRRGVRRVSRSQIVRLALRHVDLDELPEVI